MEKRKVAYKKKELKKTPKEKQERLVAAKKGAAAIVVGKAYTLDELQLLMAALSSGIPSKEIAAVAEFTENQGAISETAANAPDVSGTEIMELVLAAVLENEQKMLRKFEAERNHKALIFIARSSSIPPRVQKKAEAILQRIEPPKPVKAAKPKKEEPSLIKIPYTPKQVETLLKNLESRVKDVKVLAAIQFIKDYPCIAPTVAKMPMLTVTKVTTKAVEVIRQNTDKVLDTMVKKKMLPALRFMASLAQVPLPIRKRAQEAAESLRKTMPAPVIKAEGRPEIKPLPQKEMPRSKEYLPLELEALLSGLGSVDRVRAVKTAAEFLRNYDIIVQAISKAPMLTVTEVTTKAAKVIEENVDAVLKELRKTKDIAAIRFLANSAKFSDSARKRAQHVLQQLIPPFEEK